ncbi:hypothetical protein STEG23_012518, partial [Scotinomys teguina]
IEKAKPIKCGTFGAASLQQRYLATGDFDGNLHIWNLEAPEMPVYSVKGHKEIINTIDGIGGLGIGEGAPEIVTGSRDGTVKVWDPRQKDDPVANMEAAQGENKRDCWTVAFGNAYNQEERVVCAGYDNGDIKLFDLRNMSLRWETNIRNGVCSLEFDRKDISMNKLVATSLEGKFHVFDMRTQHPTKGFASVTEKAHKSTIWQVRHLPQNRELFLTAGGAGSLHLWKYNRRKVFVENEEMHESRHPEKKSRCKAKGRPQKAETSQCMSLKIQQRQVDLFVEMAGEEMNEDYPVEIHESLSALESSLGAVDDMLKTMMSVSRNELLQKLDPLEQAKVDLVSAYTLNSMFWVYLATQGVNPKEHPVKQELTGFCGAQAGLKLDDVEVFILLPLPSKCWVHPMSTGGSLKFVFPLDSALRKRLHPVLCTHWYHGLIG